MIDLLPNCVRRRSHYLWDMLEQFLDEIPNGIDLGSDEEVAEVSRY